MTTAALDPEVFDTTLETHVLTDKENTKTIPCVVCRRPCVVTTFLAPAKCRCKDHRNSDSVGTAQVGVPIPGHTDPAKATNLADCLVNAAFAKAVCPVRPDDPEHEMELKSISHASHHGPMRDGVVVEPGEVATHQCLKCHAVTSYSTQHIHQYRRQNEPRESAKDFSDGTVLDWRLGKR